VIIACKSDMPKPKIMTNQLTDIFPVFQVPTPSMKISVKKGPERPSYDEKYSN